VIDHGHTGGRDGWDGPPAAELVQRRWYAWDYELRQGGHAVAEIRVGYWRERGEVVVGGVPYRVRPLDWWGRRFIVAPGDHPVARAEREGLVPFAYLIEHQGQHWLVRSQGLFRRGVTVYAGMSADRAVGEIRPVGWFHRRATALLPPDMPPLAQAFAAWLAVLNWKRRASRR